MRVVIYTLLFFIAVCGICFLEGFNDGWDKGELSGVFDCQFNGKTVEDL